jgi:hypothetical protein
MALRPSCPSCLPAFSLQLRIVGDTQVIDAPPQALAYPLRVMPTRTAAPQDMAGSIHEPPSPGDGVVLIVTVASHVTLSTRAITWTTPVVLA